MQYRLCMSKHSLQALTCYTAQLNTPLIPTAIVRVCREFVERISSMTLFFIHSTQIITVLRPGQSNTKDCVHSSYHVTCFTTGFLWSSRFRIRSRSSRDILISLAAWSLKSLLPLWHTYGLFQACSNFSLSMQSFVAAILSRPWHRSFLLKNRIVACPPYQAASSHWILPYWLHFHPWITWRQYNTV